MKIDEADKYVLVTGATRGLGRTLALHLVERGYQVIGTGRGSEPPSDWPESAQLHYAALNLEAGDTFPRFVKQVEQALGPLYGLVNNAALGRGGVLAAMHEAEIQRLTLTNLMGTMLLTKQVIRKMLLRQSGRVITVSSVAASQGFSGLSVYSATKGGLVSFSRSLAREMGPAGITVNCILPGFMETEMTQGYAEQELQAIRRRSPFGQLVEPQEVAAAVEFLLSPEAGHMTGLDWVVDGGSSL